MSGRFRKAIDVNSMVVATAVSVIVIIGLFILSRGTMESLSNSQTGVNNAITEGLDKLKE